MAIALGTRYAIACLHKRGFLKKWGFLISFSGRMGWGDRTASRNQNRFLVRCDRMAMG
ncbi:hypothetical protein AB3M80_28010 [Arthrospira platensis BEA 1257B]